VLQQLPLERDGIGGHARHERVTEVGAEQIPRQEREIQQALSQREFPEALLPLRDRLDVVEPPALLSVTSLCSSLPPVSRLRFSLLRLIGFI